MKNSLSSPTNTSLNNSHADPVKKLFPLNISLSSKYIGAFTPYVKSDKLIRPYCKVEDAFPPLVYLFPPSSNNKDLISTSEGAVSPTDSSVESKNKILSFSTSTSSSLPLTSSATSVNKGIQESVQSPYALMRKLLRQTDLRKYQGNFFLREENVFRQLSSDELKEVIFNALEEDLAAGKGPQTIRAVQEFLSANPHIRAEVTTDSLQRVFFTNCALNPETGACSPFSERDFFTSYVSCAYLV